MACNKVQFQKGLSMTEFIALSGTHAQCHAAQVASRWPEGFVCPDCGHTGHCTFVRKGLQYWQSAYREQTTAISDAVFQATKLPLTCWFLAIRLPTQAKNNFSTHELKRQLRQLGAHYKTAWLMKHKLREVMFVRDQGRQFDDGVEIDDAYLGCQLPGGKPEAQSDLDAHRPTASLVNLTRLRHASRGWPASGVCTVATKETLFCEPRLAQVISDGLGCFAGVKSCGARNECVVIGGWGVAAGSKLARFRAINTFSANPKTAFSDTHHAFDFAKCAHRYLAEVQHRFHRRFDLRAILGRLLFASARTSPRPERLILVAEVGG